MDQHWQQVPFGVGRDRDLQDEQRDRDREDAIAERLEPPGLQA
jgi:hypothetical protein